MSRYVVVHTDAGMHPLTPAQVSKRKAVGARVAAFDGSNGQGFSEAAGDADVILNADFPLPAGQFGHLRQRKVVARHDRGVDNFYVQAATAHGILVANAPEFSMEELGERALLLLAAACLLPTAVRDDLEGRWRFPGGAVAAPISGQTLGLVWPGESDAQLRSGRRRLPCGSSPATCTLPCRSMQSMGPPQWESAPCRWPRISCAWPPR